MINVKLIFFICLPVLYVQCSLGKVLDHRYGVDIIFNKDWKLSSADVFVSKNIYFVILSDNGKSLLKSINFTSVKTGEMLDVLQYPVQSAESVAVDWLNSNLYWADKTNRFIEVVDLSYGLHAPISRHRRRILFTRAMADIHSLVVDPSEQYLFWLQIGADMVLERARLDGSERRVIYRSSQYKSSSLAIDRHRKMLFWWGMEGKVHRVDYQGQTRCSMVLKGEWKYLSPSFLTFTDGKLIFIYEDRLWATTFTCGPGPAAELLNTDQSIVPTAIVATKHQLLISGENRTSPCEKHKCSSICLPMSEVHPHLHPNHQKLFRCTCSTGIDLDNHYPKKRNSAKCPLFPLRSLIVASHPQIYQVSLDTKDRHLEPLFENAGIPFRLAYDSVSSSLLYSDYNSSSIFSFPLNGYGHATPERLRLDLPIFSRIPASFAVDDVSRNIYWMNDRSSEVWVARISSFNRLKYAALLLSWLPNSGTKDHFSSIPSRRRPSQQPGELAVDSVNRFLFVTIIGDSTASIERYWLDGSHKFNVIKSPNIISPLGLALDHKGHQLFFVDSARDEMIAIDYQGTDKRVITRTFPDFFGLTYNDGFIYWTDIENLSVNVIKTDGSKRSVLTTTHYLKAPTMPVIVVSRTDQSSTHTTSNGLPDIRDGNNYLLNYAPCRDGFNNKCDQLCFPTRHNDQSYSCGCSNPAHVLLNSSRCSRSSKMFVYYNQSTMITHQLSSSSPGNDEVSGSSRVAIALGKKKKKATASNNDHNLVDILALQLDHFRNHAYWIDGITNCIMKTSTSSYSLNQWQILCLVSEKITNIGLDIVRNNLYVTITSSFWSRITLIRLPFPNSEVSWRKLIISSQTKNKIMGAVAVHSALKYIFWFEAEAVDRLNITEVYQANLDGTDVTKIWRGVADINEIAVDDHANQVWWKNSDKGIIYKHDIVSKEIEKLHLSWDILKKRHSHSKDWLHIYPMMHSLYIYLHDSIFYIDSTDLRSVISYSRLKLILYISNESVPIKGFSFVYRSTSASMKKVALAKIDPNAGSIIMCPKSKADAFIQCSQFCLPTSHGECGCGSIFSLSADGSTCTDSSDFLMVMTTAGEIINIKVNSAGSGGGSNEKEEFQLIEMMDFPEQKLVRGKTFIDAVYWMSRNVILRLDNNGYLSGIDHTRSFLKIKNYKQLTIQQEKGGNTSFFSLNSYERIYKYFLNRDDSTFKRHHSHYHDDHNSNHDHYENWHRYSMAIDPITDTLLWSDWVTGFIAAERLNMERNRIEFLGLILDFRHSSRRPLQIAIAPISSSLIWISADFHAQFPSTAQASSFRLNGSSMWRQFWIEMSDLDGSRRSVLVKDPGIPTCFTVDIHSGRIYWIDMRTNRLMFLYVQWDTFLIRSRHIFGHNMKVTVGSVLATRSSSLLSMVVLKKHLFWIDPLQQVIASTSVNPGFFYKTLSDKAGLTDRTQAASHSLPFLQHKLPSIVRMMARVSQEIFKTMSIGILLKNHPCSHITHSSSSSSAAASLSNQNQPCSHFCLSTLPIGLAEGYSYLMTRQHLAGKFRCSCPVSMVMTSTNKLGVCLKSQFVKCDRHEIVCRAGLVFLGPEGMSATNCLPLHHQCDMTEDCLDGSDEIGCNSCNVTHSYSCSGSGICLSLSKRCDGVVDCESDEQCCGDQKFECLSGVDSRRCLSVTDRCNGIRDCIDGSDEHKCHSSDIGLKNDRSSGAEEQVLLGNLSNNHTVAIIAGTVAITACSIAVVYICVTRRKRHKTVHESCLFRANNVNIMFMSQPRRNSRSHRFSRPPYQRPPGSMESLHHAKSCDIIDTLKQQYDETDPASQSLTSLSDCYRRIKNPYPSACSALGRPLFSAHDDIFFQLSRIRKRQVLDASNASNEKLEKLPPSIATVNSAEDIDKIEDDLDNHPMVSHNSLASSSRCESELEEIYVHRYQAMRSPSVLYNYPSSVLQNLLSACNQTSQLYSSQTTVSRDYIFENIYRRRRRKLFKRRMKHKPTKPNESVSPSASPGLNLFSNDSQLNIDSSSNLNISPPPPSPITALST